MCEIFHFRINSFKKVITKEVLLVKSELNNGMGDLSICKNIREHYSDLKTQLLCFSDYSRRTVAFFCLITIC